MKNYSVPDHETLYTAVSVRKIVRFEVVIAMKMTMYLFWVVMPNGFISRYEGFTEIRSLQQYSMRKIVQYLMVKQIEPVL